MCGNSDFLEGPNRDAGVTVGVAPQARSRQPFYRRRDWCSFSLTTGLTLAVYLVTLTPDVTPGLSGIFSTGALYAGVPSPPGYPVWTLYAHCFAIMPIGNVAWRVALSSAVAGALACGLIALTVSRGGLLIVRPPLWTSRFGPKEEGRLGVVCGCVAGLGFGFDGGFWKTAVVPEPWALSVLLLALVLCHLMKWAYGPDRRRCLYGASFVYGLTVSNSQALFAAALGLQILVLLTDRRLVRDTCLANSLLFGAGLWAGRPGYGTLFHARVDGFDYLRLVFVLAGIGSVVTAFALVIRTRRLSGEWRAVSTCCAMFLFGLSVYLYSPLASMTNPPANWGYPRTAEGFIHLVTRGQYERIEPTASVTRLAAQLRMYGELAATDFGILYLMAALLPFCFLHRMRTQERNWMLGLLAVYLCLVLLLLVVLNPSDDRFSREICRVFFSASHLVLAVWAGYGLILFGWLTGRRAVNKALTPSDT